MDLREELDSVDRIRDWVREDAIDITSDAMRGMVDGTVYEGDLLHALEKGAYLGLKKRPGGAVFTFLGPAKDGGPIAFACRLTKECVRFVAVHRLPYPPPERN